VATISGDELVVDEATPRSFRQTRGQETELPIAIKMHYGDLARDDQPAGTEARRSTGGSQRTLEYAPPVVMAENMASAICERELHSAWTGRERAEMVLPPSRLALDPGDVVDFLPTGRMLRIANINDGAARTVDTFAVEPMALAPVALARSAGPKVPATVFLDPVVAFIDGPLLADGHADHAGYIGGMRLPFRSGLAAWRSPSTSGYTLDTLLPIAVTIGVTTGDVYPGPVWRWDRVNSLYLRLFRGSLESAEELQVLNGSNALLLENQDGEWELLQFATATPNGARNYILTDLLRGQKGTEHAMRSPVPAGARLVLVDAGIRQTGISPTMVGLPLNWRVGPADRDIGSEEFADLNVTLQAKARRPLSPARLNGFRDAATGDWLLKWIRRTRIGGDSWDVAEVPLGEANESYRLEILAASGGAVKRAFDTAVPEQLYTAAQQTADFGAPQTTFWARVAQRSATFGLGIFTETMIWS
jgi:hypothetical protein